MSDGMMARAKAWLEGVDWHEERWNDGERLMPMSVALTNLLRKVAREVGTRTVDDDHIERCSWCGKRRGDAGGLIVGPRTSICHQCVGLCADIVAEQAEPIPEPGERGEG